MKLSPEHIARIKEKIKFRRVYYSDIQSELTDHIACKIEDELKSEQEFELVLQKVVKEVNPKKFQTQLLLQTHANSFREFFGNFGNIRVMVKTMAITFVVGSFINLFSKNTPEFAEAVLKSAFIIASYSGFILGLWKNKYLNNARVLTSANVLFLVASFSQFVLRLEWLTWTGANTQQLLFFMTACFSFILCSGYRNLFRQFRKFHWQ